MAGNSSGLTWTAKGGDIRVNLEKLDPKLYALVSATIDFARDKAIGRMKQNAPWTDRTGNARATLNAKSKHDRTQHIITLFGGVPYQIWLEIRWAGKYAIITPNIKETGEHAMKLLNGLFARLKGS